MSKLFKNTFFSIISLGLIFILSEFTYRIYWTYAVNSTSEDKFEIYAIGGSTVVGVPYDGISFPLIASKLFNGKINGKKIVITNLAKSGESIYPQAIKLRKNLLRKNPQTESVLVIYSGHNEHIQPHNAEFSHFTKWIERNLIIESYLLSEILRFLRERTGFPERENTLENYEFYLKEILEIAKQKQIKVIISTVVSNKNGIEPSFSSDKNLDDLLLNGLLLEQKGDFLGAINHYRGLLDMHLDLLPLTHYLLARNYEKIRNIPNARKYYDLAFEKSPQINFGRAFKSLNQLIIRIAKINKLELIDTEKEFQDLSENGFIGNDLFVDGQHPNMDGYLLLANSFADKLSKVTKATKSRRYENSGQVFKDFHFGRDKLASSFVQTGSWLIATSCFHPWPKNRMLLAKRNFESAILHNDKSFSGWFGLGISEISKFDSLFMNKNFVNMMGKIELFYTKTFCMKKDEFMFFIDRFKKYNLNQNLIDTILKTYAQNKSC